MKKLKNWIENKLNKIKGYIAFIVFASGVITICVVWSGFMTVVEIGVLKDLSKEIYHIAYQAPKTLETTEISLTEGVIREVTAYNAGDPAQTDSSPCTSANGENICLALELGYKRCAANFVPIGTDLHIQNYGECKVTDRMNSRYQNRVDIAMTVDEKTRAIKFGLQNLVVRIIE